MAKMLLVVFLLLILCYIFISYEQGFLGILCGIAAIIVLISEALRAGAKVGAKATNTLTAGMKKEIMDSKPKPPSGEYLKEIVKEAGKKTGEAMAPPEYKMKYDNLLGKLAAGTKSFWSGINKLFRK